MREAQVGCSDPISPAPQLSSPSLGGKLQTSGTPSNTVRKPGVSLPNVKTEFQGGYDFFRHMVDIQRNLDLGPGNWVPRLVGAKRRTESRLKVMALGSLQSGSRPGPISTACVKSESPPLWKLSFALCKMQTRATAYLVEPK